MIVIMLQVELATPRQHIYGVSDKTSALIVSRFEQSTLIVILRSQLRDAERKALRFESSALTAHRWCREPN